MSEHVEDTVGWREIVAPGYRAPLIAACLGVWLHAADGLLVSTMTPAIVADIGGLALVPWTFALYEMGTIVVGAAGGLLSMRYGIRLPMALAGALFTLGCAISALAPTMEILLLGRVFQGLGGGGLMAFSFVLAAVRFPPRLVPRVMAAISTIWGVSAFTGPLIGGIFVEFAHWRGGFWFFALQALVLAAWIILQKDEGDAPRDEEAEHFPIRRLAWLCGGVLLVAYAGIDVAPLSTAIFVLLGIACLVLFLWLDQRHEESRLLPPSPISFFNPVGAAIVMIMCYAAATTAVTIYVPLLITSLHGVSVLVAGYIIALESIAWTVAALLVSGQPPQRDRLFILTGMAIITAGVAGLIYAVPEGPVWLVAVFASMIGFGFGTAWTFVLRLATGIAPKEETRRVSSALPTVHRLGFALGAAFVGIVANASGIDDPGQLKFAAAMIFIASLPLALLGLFAAIRFVGARV